MCIDKTDSGAGQLVGLKEFEKFFFLDGRHEREAFEQAQDLFAVLKTATRQFADDERMTSHLAVVEKGGQTGVPSAQMIDPN